jgi:TetR/AcrR family transcriptional regulator, mexJK operon transcriptional repressor
MRSMQEKMLAVRKQHVLDAAVTVFAEKGFQRATIRDIALVAGVSDGTIYNLFDNKAALLHAILAESSDQQASMPDLGNQAPPSLKDLIRARWSTLGPTNLAMLRVILSEALIDPEFRELYLHSLLSPAIDQLAAPLSTTRDPQSAALDARLMTGLFFGLVMLRLMGDAGIESHEDALIERLGNFITHGLNFDARSGQMK